MISASPRPFSDPDKGQVAQQDTSPSSGSGSHLPPPPTAPGLCTYYSKRPALPGAQMLSPLPGLALPEQSPPRLGISRTSHIWICVCHKTSRNSCAVHFRLLVQPPLLGYEFLES